MDDEVIFSQDWLGSTPYFFNEKTHLHGAKIQDAFDPYDFTLSHAGVSDFLTFGYSVFGSTPIRDVQFVPASHDLMKTPDGHLYTSRQKYDPVEGYLDKTSTSEDALELLFSWNPSFESTEEILPLSNGMDSRLLALNRTTHHKTPKCFTYGTSRRQWDSDEVHGAADIASALGLPWQRVDLSGFHDEIPFWSDLFGSSVHLHGMYQVRFYREIKKQVPSGTVISGIIGDLWARSHDLSAPGSALELRQYSYNHGIGLQEEEIGPQIDFSNLELEFEQLDGELSTEVGRTVYLVRTKMMLLSYLRKVPESFGYSFASPFLDPNVALTIATIERNQRVGRQWLKKFFEVSDVPINPNPVGMRSPHLDLGELSRNALPPLSPTMLSTYVDPSFTDWVNRKVQKVSARSRISFYLLEMSRIGPTIGRKLWDPGLQKAYNAYMCLRPIQELLDLTVSGPDPDQKGNQ